MSSFFQPAVEPPSQARSAAEALAACISETFAVLRRAGLAKEADLLRTQEILEGELETTGFPGDVLAALIKVQGTTGELLGWELTQLSNAMSRAMYPVPPVIPFAAKFVAPTALYENFKEIHEMAKLLMAPVIYAEDTDAIGVGGVNPVAVRIMAEEILAIVDRRLGIKPFVTTVRMEYDSWAMLTRKQFSL